MKALHLQLRQLDEMPSRALWRETFFFLASFVATIGGSLVLFNHAVAVLA